jgi:adenosylhomocysteine nucleosidase
MKISSFSSLNCLDLHPPLIIQKRYRIPILILSIALSLVGCQQPGRLEAERLDTSERILLLSAFEPELVSLLKNVHITDQYVINGRTFTTGELTGKPVVLALSGISMVNAAMTTQTALDHFTIKTILFSGIAGGVSPNLNIGDVVVPDRWAQYQEQVAARQSEQGWDTGQFRSEYGNYGMLFPQPVRVTHNGGQSDKEEILFWFPVSADLLETARLAAGGVRLEQCNLLRVCLDRLPVVVIGGNGVSGSTFVDNAEYRQWIWENFEASAVDMESAAVAHVAYSNGIPFIAFRSLSDLAGGGPNANELPVFFQLAANNAARVVLAFLGELK